MKEEVQKSEKGRTLTIAAQWFGRLVVSVVGRIVADWITGGG